ncbi:MAG: hypothetical protein O7A06_07805 [Acidobacteria bacterium]|nr:hypothetical protein [Acidobacteriota bacterium]
MNRTMERWNDATMHFRIPPPAAGKSGSAQEWKRMERIKADET